MCGKVEDLSLRQLADSDGIVEVEARHDPGARVSTNPKEGLEGALLRGTLAVDRKE